MEQNNWLYKIKSWNSKTSFSIIKMVDIVDQKKVLSNSKNTIF